MTRDEAHALLWMAELRNSRWFMYDPIVETLRCGLRPPPANRSVRDRRRVSVGRGVLGASEALERLQHGDLFVHIGPHGAAEAPWLPLRRAGVRTVYYQTEPLAERSCWSGMMGAPTPDEVWDYSWGNVMACRALQASLRRARPNDTIDNALGEVVVRHLPPGHYLNCATDRGADNRGAPLLAAVAKPEREAILLGYPFFNGRRACYERVQRAAGNRLHAEWSLLSSGALDAWWNRRGRQAVHLHVHKHCHAADGPAPAFRFATLLSRGAAIVSQHCHPRDERLYAGLVQFGRVGELAPLLRNASRTSNAIEARFRRRFRPARLLARAGVYDMLAEHWKATGPPLPEHDEEQFLPALGYCAATEPLVEGDCRAGAKGSYMLRARWRAEALRECASRCLRCARCAHLSVSVRFADCSWYADCDHPTRLRQSPSGFETLTRAEAARLLGTAGK